MVRWQSGLALALTALLAQVGCPSPAWAAPAPDPLAHLRAGHPRLILTDEALRADMDAARSDPVRAALNARIVETAEAILTAPPIRHMVPPGEASLDQVRRGVYRVTTCAMAFRLTGDPRFADRARRDLLTIAAFPDWGPDHFLDVGESSFAVALGYDWLFNALSPADRASLREALLQKSLRLAEAAYHPAAGKTGRRTEWARKDGNWNQVCNAGAICAALALADETPTLSRDVLAGALASLPHGMGGYAPDGEYPEGPGYWTYGTTYAVIAIASMESALGSDLGVAGAPGFDRTALYHLAIQGPFGRSFNYADSTDDLQNSPACAWLAYRFKSAAALHSTRAQLAATLATPGPIPFDPAVQGNVVNRFFALHAAWFPGLPPESWDARPLPLDVHFRGIADIALFRSSWDDPRALFVGFKAGANSIHHNHLDLGSFVLDADGRRWAVDLGPDSYELPGYFDFTHGTRWRYFRTNNLGHNTVTPGSLLQDPGATASIIAFGSTPGRAFAVADLTGAYPSAARSLLRGIAVLGRSQVLVQDEYEPRATGLPLQWRMVTRATIALGTDRRSALLTDGGRTLRVEVLSPAQARMSVGSTRPPTKEENPNSGTALLQIDAGPGAASAPATLAVLLSPVGSRWKGGNRPALVPLVDWR